MVLERGFWRDGGGGMRVWRVRGVSIAAPATAASSEGKTAFLFCYLLYVQREICRYNTRTPAPLAAVIRKMSVDLLNGQIEIHSIILIPSSPFILLVFSLNSGVGVKPLDIDEAP